MPDSYEGIVDLSELESTLAAEFKTSNNDKGFTRMQSSKCLTTTRDILDCRVQNT